MTQSVRASDPSIEAVPDNTRPAPRTSHAWIWVVAILVVAGVVAYFLIRHLHSAPADGQSAHGAARGPVPVVVSTAHRGSMPIYLNGLGTVTPLNTVTVRPRVDGQIMKVYYTEGQAVTQGQPLVEIDPRPFQVQLDQAQGQLAKDQASLKNAQLDLERYKSIASSITQQQIDTQQSAVTQAEGAVKTDQAAIDNAKLQLVYAHITAPISGRIGLRLVDEGNIVHASDAQALAVITQIEPITVIFPLPQDQISQVFSRPDHGKDLPVDVFDRDITRKIASGTLLAVDNQVDPTTGTVRLRASFPNQNHALFPNQFVNARLLVDTLQNVVIIPSAGVQRGPDSTYAYLVKPDKTVELRNVRVGPTEGDQSVIEQGIAAGDVVVIDGVDKLQPGAPVSAKQAPAPTTRPGGGPPSSQHSETRPTTTRSSPSETARPRAGASGDPSGPPSSLTHPHRPSESGDAR